MLFNSSIAYLISSSLTSLSLIFFSRNVFSEIHFSFNFSKFVSLLNKFSICFGKSTPKRLSFFLFFLPLSFLPLSFLSFSPNISSSSISGPFFPFSLNHLIKFFSSTFSSLFISLDSSIFTFLASFSTVL